MNSTLNKTSQYFRCVGHLYEKNLKREETKLKQRNADGTEASPVMGERIMGSIAVRTSTGIHTFSVYAQSLTSKGEESKQWKMYCDAMDWNPEVNGDKGEEATLVNIEGTVEINDYVGQDGNVKSGLRWRVGRANTKVDPEEKMGVTLNATLFIANMRPEVRNEEETGRLLVTLYGANNQGECFPVEAIVEDDIADDFSDAYETGMTVPFEFQLNSRQVGGKKKGKMKVGHGSDGPNVNQGFTVSELILVGGNDEIEEPEELSITDEEGNEVEVKTEWIDPKVMKKAIKLRQEKLDQLKAEGPKKKATGGSTASSLANAKKAAKVGKTKAAPIIDDDDFDFGDDDLPF